MIPKGVKKLYSVGTELAYRINKNFYGDIHYVWCADCFHSMTQPPTSDPATICSRYLEQIKGGDRHAYEINANIAGILRGAEAKLKQGVIDDDTYTKIKKIVAVPAYSAFFPVIYIIEVSKVKSKCIDVPIEDRASNNACEYRIEDLKRSDFTIIHTKDFLANFISASEDFVVR